MFKKKNVDSILAGARLIATQLRTCAEQESLLSTEQQIIADEARDKAIEHGAESVRADKLAIQWDKLVNGE